MKFTLTLLFLFCAIAFSAAQQQDERVLAEEASTAVAGLQDARELPREGTYEIISTSTQAPQIAEDILRSINSMRKYDEDFVYVVDPKTSIKIYSLQRIRQAKPVTTTTQATQFTHQD